MTGRLRERLCALNERWLSLAQAGQLAEAWQVSDRALEARRELDCSNWPRHQQFIWRGVPLEGRRVLIRCYHGLGDTLQFVRFVPAIRRMAQEVTLWVQPTLVPLLSRMDCADRLMPLHEGAPDVEYDVDVELCELAHVLRSTNETLAREVPYLHVGAIPMRSGSGLRVGLVWAAGDWDERRSIPVASLARFGQMTGIEWRLMQRGPALSQWNQGFGRAPPIKDIVDEARALLALDLLITVDTCSAHLAGALGIPVWNLLHQAADWRWMRDRSDTPWYPTMRLFRQRRAGDWEPVLEEVRRELLLMAEAASTAE